MVVPVWDGKSSSFDKRCLSGHYTCIDKLPDGGFRRTNLFVCSFVPSVKFEMAADNKSPALESIVSSKQSPDLSAIRAGIEAVEADHSGRKDSVGTEDTDYDCTSTAFNSDSEEDSFTELH